MIEDYQPWMILQEKVDVFDKLPAFVYCDRRQHLLILTYQANKHAPVNSTITVSDYPSINNGRSTHTVEVETVSKFLFSFFIKRFLFFNKNKSLS